MKVVVAQLPDIAHSDDKVMATDKVVVMLDGASAFRPVPVPASVYADRLGRWLMELLRIEPDRDLRDTLRAGIERTARDLDLVPGRSPSSTVTIIRQADTYVDVLVLGDNIVMLSTGLISDNRLDGLGLKPRQDYLRRLAMGAGYDTEHRALLVDLQNQQTAMRNRDGGYWIAEADPGAAEHAIVASDELTPMWWALLATDGAYGPMQHMGLADPKTLLSATVGDLDTILRRCWQWEAVTDPLGRHFPRSKQHDDKSLAVLTASERRVQSLNKTILGV